MTHEHRGVPEHVLRAGAAAAASPGLLALIDAADRTASMPDPSRGQLWRASWRALRSSLSCSESPRRGRLR